MIFLSLIGFVITLLYSYKYFQQHMATELVDKLLGKRVHDCDRTSIDDVKLSRFVGLAMNALSFCFIFMSVGVHFHHIEIFIIASIAFGIIGFGYHYFIIVYVVNGKCFRKK